MGSEIILLARNLPSSPDAAEALRAIHEGRAVAATGSLGGFPVTVYRCGEETVWVQLQLGDGPRWFGPGDLRNAAVEALVERILA